MTSEQEQKLNEVWGFIQSLKRASSIPLSFDQAIRERFSTLNTEIYDSSVNPNTKEQVHEATSFPQTFNGFKTDKDGTILIPFYNV